MSVWAALLSGGSAACATLYPYSCRTPHLLRVRTDRLLNAALPLLIVVGLLEPG